MRRVALAHPWPLLMGTATLLFVVMVMSFTPTPLYPLYQQMWGISDGYIGLAFSAYPIGVVITCLLVAQSASISGLGWLRWTARRW